MDKLNLYRELIQKLLTARGKLRSKSDPIESQALLNHGMKVLCIEI